MNSGPVGSPTSNKPNVLTNFTEKSAAMRSHATSLVRYADDIS